MLIGLEKVVYNGTVLLLEPKKAVEVRARIRQLNEVSKSISAQVKSSFPGLYGESLPTRRLARHIESPHVTWQEQVPVAKEPKPSDPSYKPWPKNIDEAFEAFCAKEFE